MRSYLQKADTERFDSEFGDNSIFTDYYNTTGGSKPIFHAALIPEEYRIKLAMGTINTIKNKVNSINLKRYLALNIISTIIVYLYR